MSDTMHEDLILELANLPGSKPGNGKKGPRRVATPGGAAYYGQPIGTIITKDMIDAKRAENAAKGIKPEKGMLSGGAGNSQSGTPSAANPNAGGSASAAGGSATPGAGGGGNVSQPTGGNIYKQPTYAAPNIDSTPPSWIDNPPATPAVKQATGLTEPTIKGPKKFAVGDASYSAPEGSRLVRPKDANKGIAFVITPDKQIHAFTASGEVTMDETTKQALTARFGSKVKPDDTLYGEQEFDQAIGLDKIQVGQKLFDAEGNDIFTKGESSWVHSELGIEVSDEDIQSLYESGELTTGKAPVAEEDINSFDWGDDDQNEIAFSEMSKEDFAGFLDTLEPGDELYYVASAAGGKKDAPKEYVTLTLGDDGLFHRELNGEDLTSQPASLFSVKNGLRTIQPTDLQPFGTSKQQEQDENNSKLKDEADKAALAAQKAQEAASKEGAPASSKTAADMAQQKADSAKKAYEDAAGITADNAAQAAAEKIDKADAKKAADAAQLESEASQAVKETDELEAAKAKLTTSQKYILDQHPVSTSANQKFLGNALAGSQVYDTDDGVFYEKVGSGNFWQNKSTGASVNYSSIGFEGGRLLVTKNTYLNQEKEWIPKNLPSPGQHALGKPVTAETWNEPTVGTVVDGFVAGETLHFTSNFKWVSSKSPWNEVNGTQVKKQAAKGEHKLIAVGVGDLDSLHVGDKIDTGNDNDSFTNKISKATVYDTAPAGTEVMVKPWDSNKQPYTAWLSEDGLWLSNGVNSYELPTDGDLYVSKIGGGETPKPLGEGDTPTEAWLQHAPVGAAVMNKVNGAVAVKKANGNFGLPGEPDGYITPKTIASFANTEDKFEILDDSTDWETYKAPSTATKKTAGDVVTYEDLQNSPVGTKFKYSKLDGTQTDYSKLNENEILMPGGIVQPLHHWKNSIDKGKVTFADDTTLNNDVVEMDLGKPIDVDVDMPEPLTPPTGDPVADKKAHDEFNNELADWEKELLDLADSPPTPHLDENGVQKDEKFTAAQLDAFNPGTKLGWGPQADYWTKTEDGVWKPPTGPKTYQSVDLATGYGNIWLSTDAGSVDTKRYKPGEKIEQDDVFNLPAGLPVKIQSDKKPSEFLVLLADGEGMFTEPDNPGSQWAEADVYEYFDGGTTLYAATPDDMVNADNVNDHYGPDDLNFAGPEVSLGEMNEFSVGSDIRVQFAPEGEWYNYSLDSDGLWYAENEPDVGVAADELYSSAVDVQLVQLGEDALNDPYQSFVDGGEPIPTNQKTEFLEGLPIGSTIIVPDMNEEDVNTYFTKEIDGAWWDPDDGGQEEGYLSDQFQYMSPNGVYIQEVGNGTSEHTSTTEYILQKQQEASDAAAAADEDLPTVADVVADISSNVNFDGIIAGGLDVPKTDVWAAIEALQSHPHGSPVYGLKGLPEGNLVADWQKAFIEKAKVEYPKSKPKAALIQLLKKSLSIPIEDDKQVNLADNPVIHIGKDKPGKNQWGMTGGDFKQSEIDEAIALLENYDGKLFKSHLTNNGNALGTLDFNSLLGGVEKDKLAQKAKAIAYLKEQVKDLAPVKPVSVEDHTPGSSTNFEAGPNWVMTPWDELNTTYDDGDQIQLGGTLETFKYDAGAPGTLKWYKPMDEETGWFSVHDIINEAIDTEQQTWVSKVNDPTNGLKKVANGTELDAMPKGSHILWKTTAGDVVPLTKGNVNWELHNGEPVGIAPLYGAATQGRIWIASGGNSSGSTEVKSLVEFKNLPNGAQVKDKTDTVYTKLDDNQWTYDGQGDDPLDNDAFGGAISSGSLFLVNKPNDTSPYIAPAADQSKPKVYTKKNSDPNLEDHTIKVYPDGTGLYKNGYGAEHFMDAEEVQKELQDQKFQLVHDNEPTLPHSYLPGFYEVKNGSGGKMSVYNDGSATYKDAAGKLESLTPEQLATWPLDTHWDYKGVGDEVLPQTPKPAAKVKTAPKKNYDFKPTDIPNGVYYLGNPTDGNTPTWHVQGGVVTQHESDGSTSVLSATKVKNAVLKGEVVNKFGNTAVLPAGYVGKVKFLNHDTNTESLKAIRNVFDNSPVLDNMSFTSGDQSLLASYGLYVSNGEFKNYIQIVKADTSPQAITTALYDYIDSVVGPKTGEPFDDNDAVGDFDWTSDNTQAIAPAYGVKHFPAKYTHFSNTEAKAAIEDIAKNFGDGATIGQHVTGMSAQAKRNWLKEFKAGNFSAMYAIEVDAAIKQGKSHVAGYKHPGYPENKSTNKVTWAPAVPGEKPAGTVDGNWTNIQDLHKASIAELDNYLIASGMQNPTQLTVPEIYSWVGLHRQGEQWAADALSVKAKQQAENGEGIKSAEPVWTDEAAPPKSYNALFAKTPYPTTWSPNAATEWLQDFISDKVEVTDPSGKKLNYVNDFADIHKKVEADHPYASNQGQVLAAVSEFFTGLSAQQEDLDNKKVYKKSASQNIKQTNHPVYNYEDQFGNKYIFKVAPDDVNSKEYRAQVEATANKMAQLFGGKSPNSEVMTLDGKLGVLQDEVPHIGTLAGFNWATADTTQSIDLANEHVIDWMLDQDDNWAPNTFLLGDGHLAGIDKGRAFAAYGHWSGLTSDSSMDVNTHLVYSDLYQAIIKKQISKEVADATWLAVRKRAAAIAKSDDAALLAMLHEATDLRTEWNVPYKIDGKQVSQDQQGFIDAFFDRKSKLPSQVEALWQDIYKKAGYGDLPEPPVTALGDNQHSGLSDTKFHESVLSVGAHGASTLVSDAGVKDGHVLAWQVTEANGQKAVFAQAHLESEAQDSVLAWFAANSDTSAVSNGAKPDPSKFTFDDKGDVFISAAKTIGHHAADGAYNSGTISNYEKAKAAIDKDLAFWSPILTPDGEGMVTFPSGAKVPYGHVDQYKMMLDYYVGKSEILDVAYNSKTTPAQTITKYTPINLDPAGSVWTDGYGQKFSQLADGNWVYNNGTVVSIVPDAKASELIDEDNGWKKWGADVTAPVVTYKAKLNTSTYDKSGTFDGFELKHGTQTAYGAYGHEYEVELPTGEKIYFRNAEKTHTASIAQRGKLSFKVPGNPTADQIAVGFQRVQDWVSTNLGVNMEAATHDDAELIYWKQMLPILADRKHVPGSKWANAAAELSKKMNELGANKRTFSERLAKAMSVEDQNAYYRDLWGKHFGQEKVAKLIADEKYLPRYDTPNYNHLDKMQGTPIWERFDYDLKDLEKAGHMLAAKVMHGDGQKDVVLSGALLSAENRLRVLGDMKGSDDQGTGGSNSVFTRVYKDTKVNGIHFILHPRAMLRTDTRSYHHGDAFGNVEHNSGYVWSDPGKSWIDNVTEAVGKSGPETDPQGLVSLFGDLEIIVFENNQAQQRNELIQKLKALGFEKIRGVAIEDRLVLRDNLSDALTKIKKGWYNQ